MSSDRRLETRNSKREEMVHSSIRIFRLWGIPVEINLSWIVVLALVTWTFAGGYAERFPESFSGAEIWLLGFFTAILLFVSILLHEFSHSLVAVKHGLPISKITLFMFGGVAHMEREVDDPALEFKMAAAGPAMTVVLVGLFYGLSKLFQTWESTSAVMRSLSNINLIVLVFNMVPGFPLDGGRLLRAAIWYRTGNLRRATRIASRIGGGFAILLMLVGFFAIFRGYLIGGLWFVFIGFFLRQAAKSSYLMVMVKQTLGHMHVADIMRTDVAPAEASLDIQTLVQEYFLRYHLVSVPVTRDGYIVGVVSFRDIKAVPRDKWSVTAVESVADMATGAIVVKPSDSAGNLIQIMMRKRYDSLPVVEGGRVIGLVTRQDLMAILNMASYIAE